MVKSVKFNLIAITIILICLITPALSVNRQPADFESWRDKAIGWATDHINSLTWSGLCMNFVACAFQQSENGYAGGDADYMAKKLLLFDGNLNPDVLDKTPGGWDNIPKGAIIFFAGTSANKIGHVGIHIGNGWIIHAFGRVMKTQISKATSLTEKGKLVVGSYMGWSYPPESWRPATQSNSIGASVDNPAVEKLNQVILTLYFHDRNRNGPVIPGAQVTGQDGSGNNFQQTTDSSGYVIIIGDPGTWSFSASADGYETNNWDQDITEDCTKHAFLKREQQSESVATQDSESSVVGEWKGQIKGTFTRPGNDTIGDGSTYSTIELVFFSDGTFDCTGTYSRYKTNSIEKVLVEDVGRGNWAQNGNVVSLQFDDDRDTNEDHVQYSTNLPVELTIIGDTMSGTGSGYDIYDIDNGEAYTTYWQSQWYAEKVGT
jgi:hypothetical protein